MRETVIAHFAAAVVTLAACAPARAVDSEKAMIAWDADRACGDDADCVAIDDCCSCSNGGARIGVARRAVTEIESRRAEACSTDDSIVEPGAHVRQPVICLTVVKSDGSCDRAARPMCRDHVCRMVL
jgi:hypothetical protein